MTEGNSGSPISPPDIFSITRSCGESLRAAGMAIDPNWVRHEIERQLAGVKPTSGPGLRVATFLRNTRLIP